MKPSNRPLFVSCSLLSHLHEYFLAINFASSTIVDCEFGVFYTVEFHKASALCFALTVTEKLGHLDLKVLCAEELRQRTVSCVLVKVSDVDSTGFAVSLRSLVRLRILLLIEAALATRSRRTTGISSSLEATIVVSGSRVVGIALGSIEATAALFSRFSTVSSTVASISSASSAVGEATTSDATSTSELRWASGSSVTAGNHAAFIVVLRGKVSLRRSFRSAPAG